VSSGNRIFIVQRISGQFATAQIFSFCSLALNCTLNTSVTFTGTIVNREFIGKAAPTSSPNRMKTFGWLIRSRLQTKRL